MFLKIDLMFFKKLEVYLFIKKTNISIVINYYYQYLSLKFFEIIFIKYKL